MSNLYGDNLVVLVATVVAVVDICFILLAVPESLPEKMRPPSWGALISWEQADPFAVSYRLYLFCFIIQDVIFFVCERKCILNGLIKIKFCRNRHKAIFFNHMLFLHVTF